MSTAKRTAQSLKMTQSLQQKLLGDQAPPMHLICDSCEQNPATVYCFQCNGNLCTTCDQQIHSNRLMRNHQRTQPFRPIKCKLHGNFVSMLCAHCQELICVNCLVEQHRGH